MRRLLHMMTFDPILESTDDQLVVNEILNYNHKHTQSGLE